MPPKVRVRFAPSPTGLFHIGSARTALFNWLFAKKEGGVFVLRVEDTDIERSKPEFEEDLKIGLQWLGFQWDEFYKQSERTQIYEEYLRKLLDENKLYYCFCSKEDLEAEKQAMIVAGIPPKYSGRCSALSEEEVRDKMSKNSPHVLRFRVAPKIITVKDIIRGLVKFDTELMGDLIVAKDLNQPLYNFTVVVDDAVMNITHVIRGEDHLSNTPKQILIAEALGFASPEFAHLPMILNPDRSKMSKRFSDTSLTDYINQGYLKEAVINFLAYLGWHPKENKEVMTIDELVEEFDLKRIQKGGAVFNFEKLDWLNSYYMDKLTNQEFTDLAKKFLPEEWKLTDAIVVSVRGRTKKMTDLRELVDFYFELPGYVAELLRWKEMDTTQIINNLQEIKNILINVEDGDFETLKLEQSLNSVIDQAKRGEFFWPLRVALSGKKISPGPFEIMEALGKAESLNRINIALDKCGK